MQDANVLNASVSFKNTGPPLPAGASDLHNTYLAINENLTDDEVDELIRLCDHDGDGQVAESHWTVHKYKHIHTDTQCPNQTRTLMGDTHKHTHNKTRTRCVHVCVCVHLYARVGDSECECAYSYNWVCVCHHERVCICCVILSWTAHTRAHTSTSTQINSYTLADPHKCMCVHPIPTHERTPVCVYTCSHKHANTLSGFVRRVSNDGKRFQQKGGGSLRMKKCSVIGQRGGGRGSGNETKMAECRA